MKALQKNKIFYMCLILAGQGSVWAPGAYSSFTSTLPGKLDVLGEKYYKPLDSAIIRKKAEPYLTAISRLCQYPTLARRLHELKKHKKGLRKTIQYFLRDPNIQLKDHVFLLELKNHVVQPYFLNSAKKLTVRFINQHNLDLGKHFLTRYQLAYHLSPVNNHKNMANSFHHSWAQKVYQGIKCIAPLQKKNL